MTPLPTPQEHDRSAFVSRCMGDSRMLKEFPDESQRAAVCYSKWREAKGGRKPGKKK